MSRVGYTSTVHSIIHVNVVLLARLNTNLAPLGARFIPYKTLVYLNVWEIKVE